MPYSKDNLKEGRYRTRKKYYSKTAFSPAHKTRWTKNEEQLVLDHTITDNELSKILCKSVASIQMKRIRLKNNNKY